MDSELIKMAYEQIKLGIDQVSNMIYAEPSLNNEEIEKIEIRKSELIKLLERITGVSDE